MIYTITVNPALDIIKDLATDGQILQEGTNRVKSEEVHAGGKGIDVTRVLAIMGAQSRATGFLGGHTGKLIEGLLQQEGMDIEFVPIANETRTNIIIFSEGEKGHKREFRLNSLGPETFPVEYQRLYDLVASLPSRAGAETPKAVAICGSLSRAMADTFYVTMIRTLKKRGVFVALDSSGGAMQEVMRQGKGNFPDLIKPNIDEFDQMVGKELYNKIPSDVKRRFPGREEALIEYYPPATEQYRSLLQRVLSFHAEYENVCILLSFGRHGIIGVRKGFAVPGDGSTVIKRAHLSTPLKEEEIRTFVGAGDAALAAYLWATKENDMDFDMCLRYAVAAATALVTCDPRKHFCFSREDVMKFFDTVVIDGNETGARGDTAKC